MTRSIVASRPWSRVKWTRAVQVAPLLGDEGAGLPANQTPAEAFAALRTEQPALAARFAAQVLPRIDAARWMAACLACGPRSAEPARMVADKAVRRWVASPSDEARRLAFEAGSVAGFDTPEGSACLAIFLSGGSMAPAGQDTPVNPPPGTFGTVVAGAVLAAAHAAGGPAFAPRIAAMLTIADGIAAGEQPA